MNLLKRLASEREAVAQKALSQARGRVGEAQDQYQQLSQYERDYLTMARGGGRGTVTTRQLVESRRFLLDIQTAVEVQRQHLQDAEAQFVRAQAVWVGSKQYARAIDTLAQLSARATRVREEKRQQLLMDQQFALRRFFHE